MAQQRFSYSLRNVAITCCAAVFLSACLSSKEDSAAFTDDVVSEARVSGSVGDGPVAGASMRVLDNGGSQLLAFQSDSRANYDVVVNASANDYPLSVTASGGTDLVTNLAPDFEMRGAVLRHSNQSVANVNPFSTVAFLLAGEMTGGVTEANLRTAQRIVAAQLNSGLASLAVSGPMTTRIDESNIAEIVRASEALSEVVRRTRDLMTGAGFPRNANQVIAAIASDLTDEVLDGRGGANADPRTGAIVTLVYAQVLIEAMANQLYVNGSDATAAMEGAINQVSAQTPSRSLDDLVATSEMLERARVGLAAAFAVDSRAQLADLHAAVSGMQPGMDRQLARSLLPRNYRTAMDSTVTNVASADAATINLINDIAQGSGDIASGNRAPSIQGTPASAVEVGSDYAFTPTASDADGDNLAFSIANRPSWAAFDASNGRLSGTPGAGELGTYSNIIISVSDGELSDSLDAFSIQVYEGNAAPSISGTPTTTVTAGQSYAFQPTASDPNGDDLRYYITNRPAWAGFNASTGELSGTPSENDVGAYASIVIGVTDGTLNDDLPPFTITVEPASASNTPPVISGNPPTRVTAGNNYSFTPTASDADGDSLTFSIANRPSWAGFNATTGRLSGTPSASDVGTYSNIVISVSDGSLSDSLAPFTITVETASASNTPPQISGNPPTQVTVGNSYSFRPTASDADGDSLTFSIANRPSWAGFNATTGRLSGTPSAGDVGTYNNIVISVSDGSLSDSLAPFSITVEAAPASNTPPEISGNPPAEINAGSNYSFTPTASDADGDNLTFSIANRPSWATFDAASGRLSGTPGDGDVGTYSNIRITVSDGTDSASLEFSITVNAVSLGSVTLTWTAPTENEDGTQLTDLAGFKIYWGTTPGVYTDSVTLNNPSITTYIVENLAPGTYEFVARSFNSSRVESTYSNTASATVN